MKRSGMTMVEAAAGVAVIGAGAALVSPALQSARVASMRAAEVQNLKTFGVAHAGYAMDNRDAIATFSWGLTENRERNWESEFEDLNVDPSGDSSAGALWQATELIRRGTGDDGTVFRRPSAFAAHRQHSHLVVLDYLGLDLYEEFTMSPGDTRLREVREAILGADDLGEGVDLASLLFPTGRDMGSPSTAGIRPLLPYITSYHITPFAYVPDSGQNVGPVASGHWLDLTSPFVPVGARSTTEVAFPGQKVLKFGTYDYTSIPGQPIYYAYREAKAAQLFFDASAGINATADANFGIRPIDGAYGNLAYDWQHRIGADEYAPPPGVTPLDVIEVLDNDGNFVENRHLLNAFYRWTAGGLQGIDFGGKPLDPFGLNLGNPYGG